MKIRCVWEHNGEDTLLYSDNFPGAFTRGQSMTIALSKMQQEIKAQVMQRLRESQKQISRAAGF